MKVPELDQQVSLNPTTPSMPQFSAPVPDAFGDKIGEAAQRLGASGQNAGAQLMGAVIERKQMVNETEAFSAYTKYGQDLQSLAHSTDPETGAPVADPQTGKPAGLLDRQMADAHGITVEYDQKQQQLQQQYLDGLKNASQKALFMRMASYHRNAMRESVIQHEAREGNQAFFAAQKAAKDQIAQSAVTIEDPAMLRESIDTALDVNARSLARQGVKDPAIYGASQQQTAAEIAEKPINQQLASGSWRTAQQMLEAVKPALGEEQATALAQRVSGRAFEDTRQSVWATLSARPELRMQDGKTFDLEKARGLIMDPSKLTLPDPITNKPLATQQREKVFDFVKTMAGEQAQQQHKQETAANVNFSNDVTTAHGQGVPVDQALKLAADPKYGFDASNVASAEAFVKKLYTERDAKSDPETLIALHRGIDDGSVTRVDDIRKAFQDGDLSKKDMLSLTNKLQRGDTQAMKGAVDAIKSQLETKLPDKPTRDAFMASLLQQKLDKNITDPAELQKLYKQNLESAPTGAPGFLRVFGGKTQAYYKTAEALQANQELVRAAGGIDHAYDLALRLGGPDNLASDTPTGRAVLALLKRGADPKRIIPSSIDAVVKNHADWIAQNQEPKK